MELLLNLLWMTLTLGSLWAIAWRRSRYPIVSPVSLVTSLLAVMCVMVLLFPVVSASDDLHPSQAVLEDASKRAQRTPLHTLRAGLAQPMMPAVVTPALLCTLVILHLLHPVILFERTPESVVLSTAGRAPPFC